MRVETNLADCVKVTFLDWTFTKLRGHQAPICLDRRQVFFVSLGGFDTHAGQSRVHPALLTRLAAALQAFQAAMAELGVGLMQGCSDATGDACSGSLGRVSLVFDNPID